MIADAKQTSALRAYLTEDLETYERLMGQLESDPEHIGYGKLVGSAFYIAAQQWSTGDSTFADVIRFVANVRVQSEEFAKVIDPSIAERLLHSAHVDGELGELDDDRVFEIQQLLLFVMVAVERFDDARLDEFLSAACELANSLDEAVVPQ